MASPLPTGHAQQPCFAFFSDITQRPRNTKNTDSRRKRNRRKNILCAIFVRCVPFLSVERNSVGWFQRFAFMISWRDSDAITYVGCREPNGQKMALRCHATSIASAIFCPLGSIKPWYSCGCPPGAPAGKYGCESLKTADGSAFNGQKWHITDKNGKKRVFGDITFSVDNTNPE